MTETDAERLAGIKRSGDWRRDVKPGDIQYVRSSPEDKDWLIAMAERAIKYREALEEVKLGAFHYRDTFDFIGFIDTVLGEDE